MGVPLVKKLSTGVALATMIALGSSTLAARGSTSFSYQPTELKRLSGDTYSFVYNINDQGQAVGYSSNSSSSHALLWDKDTVRNLGTLGGNYSYAYAINNSGQVVGSSQTSSGDKHAFLWVNGTMRDLGTLGGKESSAYSINSKGQVVGSSKTTSGDEHAFLWENGKMTDLAPLGSKYSYANEINNQGQVVGASDYRAFLWENGKMTDLATLGGGYSYAYGINNKGQVIGSSTTQKGYSHCALWSEGKVRDLSPRFLDNGGGLANCVPAGINDRGVSVGYFNNVFGQDIKPSIWFNSTPVFLEKLVPIDLAHATVEDINNKGQIVVNARKSYLLTPTWVTQ